MRTRGTPDLLPAALFIGFGIYCMTWGADASLCTVFIVIGIIMAVMTFFDVEI